MVKEIMELSKKTPNLLDQLFFTESTGIPLDDIISA